MAKLLILIALCILPALVSSRPMRSNFMVQGRVYCDTCLAGFETSATTYIAGAKVRLECRERESGQLTYAIEGKTAQSGMYEIQVSDDRGNDICEVALVSSPHSECATPMPGRERARVFLTQNNGIASYTRYANNLGFQKDAPIVGCSQLLKQYQEFDD